MLQAEEITYKVGDLVCRGFIVRDKAHPKPKPCVMIAHDWSGRSEMFCEKARQLAALGYVGFAIDMYGDAKLGETTAEKKALMNPVLENRQNVTIRMLAAYQAAADSAWVDDAKIAAIGYCFGGLCVLDLARAGAHINGVVSFHGILTPPSVTVCEKMRAKVLVLHGYEDPMVPPSQVEQFAKEMTMKNADWQIHMYGHTQHAFTNPEANDDALGLHYNKKAAQRSWANAEMFLKEVL